jgi:acetyl esterase/lipase
VRDAAQFGVEVAAIDYRMPPDHPYPAALDDCVAVYAAEVARRGARNIIVGGGSAGGNLAAALMLRAKAQGLPMPAALMLMSPEVDLTESGDSFEVLMGIDPVLKSRLTETIALYADGHPLDDPLLSPLFGDLAGFPPTLLQSGTRDLFLSNTVRMHRRLRQAGVAAELHIFEAMPHGGFFAGPEDEDKDREVAHFVATHWPTS